MITVTTAKCADGEWLVQFSDTPAGQWTRHKSAIDAMFFYISRVAGTPHSHSTLGIDRSAVSKARHNNRMINDKWILWAHEASGAPVSSLRIITGT